MKTLTCIDTKSNKGIYSYDSIKTVQFINGVLVVTYVRDGETKTQIFTKESLADNFVIIC